MNITQVKADLTGMLHGTTLNQVQNLDGVINRAARQLLLDIDPQETKRTIPLANPLYDEVFNYALPVDVKGNRIIDIKPQVNRTLRDRFGQAYNQDFDVFKDYTLSNNFTIDFNTSVKSIRIDANNITTGITLNQCDSISGNGTWAVSGGANTLTQETQNYAAGSAALKFNLTASASPGLLTNSTMTALDMTDHENVSSLFYYVFLQTGSVFTGFTLKWGSDASNYWSKTSTVTHEGTTFANGWNLIRADWVSATKVGTPVVTAVNYVEVTFTYDGTVQTGCELDSIVSRKGVIYNIEYYSKYIFRDSVTNAFQETVTDDSNLVNLDTESYDLLLNQIAFMVAQQMQGIDVLRFDGQFFLDKYNEGVRRYTGLYKSEVTKPKTQYYRQTNPSYQRFFGRRFWN